MKKIVLAGLIAISMIALSQHEASAWVNSKFGIGLNWERQAGGNNFGWGAWRSGQPPGPEGFGGGQGGPSYGPSFGSPAPQAYAPVPQGSYDAPAQPFAAQYAAPYQFANYPRQVYYYYPTPSYYYGR